MKILLASTNPEKHRELEAALRPMGLELVSPLEIGGLPPVEEDEDTFGGNAALKARSAARASGLWSLADDSGLEVDHLGGAPGVLSARFAGRGATPQANNALLLRRLEGVPEGQRRARFVCALVLARPDGRLAAEVQGTARGCILTAPRGQWGFGYDPLFLFTEEGFAQTGRTFAEIALEEKTAVSHRGRAIVRLLSMLPRVLTSPLPPPARSD